jgi:hypothetical protein
MTTATSKRKLIEKCFGLHAMKQINLQSFEGIGQRITQLTMTAR